MKTLLVLTAAAAFVAVPSSFRAEDAIPPTPPGSTTAPASPALPTEHPTPAPAASTTEQSGERQARGGPQRSAPGERLQMMKERLGLTPEQVEKLKPIFEKEREKGRALREDPKLSEEQKREKVRELMKSAMEEIAPILTPEQQAKLHAGMQKRREEMQKRGGPPSKK